jgi:hypothetical protein
VRDKGGQGAGKLCYVEKGLRLNTISQSLTLLPLALEFVPPVRSLSLFKESIQI